MAILAAEKRPLSRVKIIDLLWSDRQEEQARASLRTLLADLREQFGSRFDELLLVDRERIALGPEVRSDLNDHGLDPSAGELFEGLDHIDPVLDEWLQVERGRHACRKQSSSGSESFQTAPSHRATAVWIVAALMLALTAGVLFLSDASVFRRDQPASNEQLGRAQDLLERGAPAAALEARRILTDVVTIDPGNSLAFAMLAEATMRASDYPRFSGPLSLKTARREARSYAKRAIEISPDASASWAALGWSYVGTAEAIKPFSRAVELDPLNSAYRIQLTQALEFDNRYDEAYLHAKQAIRLNPRDAEPIITFLRTAVQLGRDEEMKAAVRSFHEKSPTATDASYVQGFLAYTQDQHGQCAKHLLPLARKGDQRPLFPLFFCLTAIGERQQAVALAARRPSLLTDILRGDAAAVAARAKSMGNDFWVRNTETLAAADLLVREGRSTELIQAFDATYDSIEQFEAQGSRLVLDPTSILLAMKRLGREKDAAQLRLLLARQVREQEDGMGLDTWSLYAQAGVALADGQADRAIDLLERCSPDCLVGYFHMDISHTGFFGQLNGHPRFDNLIQQNRDRIDEQRRLAGLAPLPNRSRQRQRVR